LKRLEQRGKLVNSVSFRSTQVKVPIGKFT
jgi:hypothetical protein